MRERLTSAESDVASVSRQNSILQQQLNEATFAQRQEETKRDAKNDELTFVYERLGKLRKHVCRIVNDTLTGKGCPKPEAEEKLYTGCVTPTHYLASPGGTRYTPAELRNPLQDIPPMAASRRSEIIEQMKAQCREAVAQGPHGEGSSQQVAFFCRLCNPKVSPFRCVPPIDCSMVLAVRFQPPAVAVVQDDFDQPRTMRRLFDAKDAGKSSRGPKANLLTSRFASTTRSGSLGSRSISSRSKADYRPTWRYYSSCPMTSEMRWSAP